jgi:shikimate kinase
MLHAGLRQECGGHASIDIQECEGCEHHSSTESTGWAFYLKTAPLFMLTADSVFLIGPMGAGKSAVGKYLARHLGFPFFDSDREIERRTGLDIPLIFAREGEPGFRQREREVIEALTAMPRIVLATGGGAVLLPQNRAALADRGCVVYLETSVAEQAHRLKQGRHRPLLADVHLPTKLYQLLHERAPLYGAIADILVSTDGRRIGRIALDLAAQLKQIRATIDPVAV